MLADPPPFKEVSFSPVAQTAPMAAPEPAPAPQASDDELQLGQSPPIDAADYILPQYSTTLFMQARVPVKFEFSSPFSMSTQRSWTNARVTLNSTCLELTPMDEPFMMDKPTTKHEQQRLVIASREIARPRSKSISLKPSISNLKQALKHDSAPEQEPIPIKPLAFTLQYAVCGHAADYTKRANCLRVRAESMQFLIQFGSPQHCIEWANAIQSGIDLALPLEHRELPKVRSLPRRRRDRSGITLQQRQRAYSTVAPVQTPPETRSRSKSTSSIAAFRLLAGLRRKKDTDTPPPTSNPPYISMAAPPSPPLEPPSPAYSHSNASTHSTSDSMSVHSTDSFSSDIDSAASSATTMSRSSEDCYKERWDPEVEQMSELAELKYATRCLKRFQRYSSWVNKITMCDNKPYLVRQNSVQLVANECLVNEQ